VKKAFLHGQNPAIGINHLSQPYLIKGREFSNPDPKSIPFFSKLSAESMVCLLSRSKSVQYVKNEAINSFIHKPNLLYVILSGKVNVLGFEYYKIFQVRDSNSHFGEIALLTHELRSVSNITFEKVTFGVISKYAFVNWLLEYPDFRFNFLELLPEKLAS
jgi:CRP-like cAMP-binding protein